VYGVKKSKIPTWTLKSKQSQRFKLGHPWVYSNELQQSPKGIEPGQVVELRDSGGEYLATGYGNPNSLISFRELTRNPEQKELVLENPSEFLLESLAKAWKLRQQLGFSEYSHRLCFGEADGLPGLVIDRYRTENGQAFVVQAHTAGADRWMEILPEVLKNLCLQMKNQPMWDQTAVIIRNDLGVRKLEGIEEQEPKVLKDSRDVPLPLAKILIRPAMGGDRPLIFSVDLVKGQKTGFFLDQWANIDTAIKRFGNRKGFEPIKILDLFSYVGQWSTQFARYFKVQGQEVQVLAVDASAQALELARSNVEMQNVKCEIRKMDIIDKLSELESNSFDIVICDPPALIKSKKDFMNGARGYQKLNSQILRLMKPGAGIVTCSCSALLDEEKFCEILGKSYDKDIQWVGRGMQSPDHPFLVQFPEGRYLKAMFGIRRDNET
jgi:23S rRNA (cytosine1962-C5)-methyltransferase